MRDHLIMEDFYAGPWPGHENNFVSEFFAFRMDQWKLILDDQYRVSGLYNLENDLSESHNLMNVPEHNDRIANMRNQFIELRNSARTSPSLNPETNCDNGEDDDGDRLADCQGSPQCDTDEMLSANFDSGTEGFVYADDTFYNTDRPAYASGIYAPSGGYAGSGGLLHLILGGVDGVDVIDGMSGGWTGDLFLGEAAEVQATLEYRLVMGRFDGDECVHVLVQIDDGTVEELDRLCGRVKDTGWKTKSYSGWLSAGDHTITLGGYNSKKTGPRENADIYFDNVEIKVIN